MFVQNAWYVGAWSTELRDKPIARLLLDEPVVLFRNAAGTAAALEDRCCHRGVPLSLGAVTEKGLMCGYHGLVFDCKGACVDIPGQSNIPERAKVKAYPTVEQDEIVWIWMGDPSLADESRIPRWEYNNDYTNWPHKYGMLSVQCNYLYLLENLMDLSHVGYVHQRTIGGSGNENANVQMKVDRTDTGCKFSRWMLDIPPAPTFAKAGGFTGNVDRWQNFEFVSPSVVLQYSGAIATGSDRDDRSSGVQIRILHAITPQTDATCLYFFSVANGHQTHDPAATDSLFEQVRATFMEDAVFVETQQKRLANYDTKKLVDIKSDVARVALNRVLNRDLEAEQGQKQTDRFSA